MARSRLGWGMKLRALAAVAVLPVVLEFMSFRRIERILRGVRTSTRRDIDWEALNRWVAAALRRLPGPWAYSCLRRAVVMAYLLRRASVDVTLHIGVSRHGRGKLSAHAWLSLDDKPFLEANPWIPRCYTEITSVAGRRPRQGELLVLTLGRAGTVGQDALRDAWENSDLTGMLLLVRFEGAELWLYKRLLSLGLSRRWWAGSFGRRLRDEARRIAATNLLIDEETVTASRILNRSGIQFMLLKGAARRARRTAYGLADAKETVDVDILVPAGQVESAWQALRKAGYEYATDPQATPEGHYHRPPVARRGVSVELHESTAQSLSPDEAWSRMTRDARPIGLEGVLCRVPSTTELLWHAVTHAQEHGPMGFTLRYFLDAVSVAACPEEIDWETIGGRLEQLDQSQRGLAVRWLRAVHRLTGVIPHSLLDSRWNFDLVKMLEWRVAVLRRTRQGSRFREKLLFEGMRASIGIGLTRVVPRSPLRHKARRKFAALVARTGYFLWKSTVATRLRAVDTQ